MNAVEFKAFVERAPWRFAKAMPDQPHEYTLRREHDNATFNEAVAYIRRHGYNRLYRGTKYVTVDLEGWHYWTMGWPVEQTLVLNRSRREDGEGH